MAKDWKSIEDYWIRLYLILKWWKRTEKIQPILVCKNEKKRKKIIFKAKNVATIFWPFPAEEEKRNQKIKQIRGKRAEKYQVLLSLHLYKYSNKIIIKIPFVFFLKYQKYIAFSNSKSVKVQRSCHFSFLCCTLESHFLKWKVNRNSTIFNRIPWNQRLKNGARGLKYYFFIFSLRNLFRPLLPEHSG